MHACRDGAGTQPTEVGAPAVLWTDAPMALPVRFNRLSWRAICTQTWNDGVSGHGSRFDNPPDPRIVCPQQPAMG